MILNFKDKINDNLLGDMIFDVSNVPDICDDSAWNIGWCVGLHAKNPQPVGYGHDYGIQNKS